MADLRIGSGSAWWGDRIEPARLNAEKGDLDYLCFETMAEATISAAQVRKRRDPSFPGYDTYLDDRMRRCCPAASGGARRSSAPGLDQPGGRRPAHRPLAARMRAPKGVKVAAVSGSLITDKVLGLAGTLMEDGRPATALAGSIVSAEAYMGAEPIVAGPARGGADRGHRPRRRPLALHGADDVRVSAGTPLDHARLGPGNGIGHVLECGAQATGGYFCDPGFKDVPDPGTSPSRSPRSRATARR